MRVQLVCQFGQPVRGLSPYADALLGALRCVPEVDAVPVDYRHPYPALLHPAGSARTYVEDGLSWFSPVSWHRVAHAPADIVHIQHWAPQLSCYLWPFAEMARGAGKRVAITVHNPQPHERARAYASFDDRLLRSASALLVHGASGCDRLRDRLGLHWPHIYSIAHGMHVMAKPPEATADDYARLRLDPSLRYVLLFGNLRGYKGVGALIDAWEQIRPSLMDVRLIVAGRLWGGGERILGRFGARLAGTADDAASLRRQLKRANACGCVTWRDGFLDDGEIDALIRISAVAVFPYLRFGGQSGAACRAAALGCPVLVSRVGALPDLAIDDSWIVQPGDVAGLAEQLVAALTKPDPREVRRQQLAAVRGFDWTFVAQEHARIYRELA